MVTIIEITNAMNIVPQRESASMVVVVNFVEFTIEDRLAARNE